MIKSQRRRWKAGKAAAIVVGTYLLSYLCNSLLGGYWLSPTWDKPRNEEPGVNDRMKTAGVMWQPRFGYNSIGKIGATDFLGYFFAPLIALDRACFHRNQLITDPDFASWSQNLPLNNVHPKHQYHFTHRP